MSDPQRIVQIDYTNYRGERSLRNIKPMQLVFENSEFHPETQWVLYAWDCAKDAHRAFALKDIHSWSVPPAPRERPERGTEETGND